MEYGTPKRVGIALVAALGFVGWLSSTLNAGVLIDDLSNPAIAEGLFTPGPTLSGASYAANAYPSRVTTISGFTSASTGGGFLVDVQVTGAGSASLGYTGPAVDLTGGLTGNTLFLDFASSTNAGVFGVTVTVNGVTSAAAPIPAGSSGPYSIAIPFTAFSLPGQLFAASKLQVSFAQTSGFTSGVTLDTIHTEGVVGNGFVPEPSAVAVWSVVALSGFGLVRCRRIWS